MDVEPNPSKGLIPEYLREKFDPRVIPNAILTSILYEHNIVVRRRATKNELVQLFEDNIKKNRKLLIHEILKKDVSFSSSRSPLGYKQTSDVRSKSSTFDNKLKTQLLLNEEGDWNLNAQFENKDHCLEDSRVIFKRERHSVYGDETANSLKQFDLKKSGLYNAEPSLASAASKCGGKEILEDYSFYPVAPYTDAFGLDLYSSNTKPPSNLDNRQLNLFSSENSLKEQPQKLDSNFKDTQNKFDVSQMFPSNTDKKHKKDGFEGALAHTPEPIFDDEPLNNSHQSDGSTDYSDSSSVMSQNDGGFIKRIKNKKISKLSMIMPWESVSRIYRNSNCSKCESGTLKPKRLPSALYKFIIIVFFPLLITIIFWLKDYYKSYNYCSPGTISIIDSNYSGYNPLKKHFNKCRACPAHAVCSDRKVILCNKSDYILSMPYLSRIVNQRYLPFFIAEPQCKEDHNAVRRRLLGEKQITTLAIMTEKVTRKWLGEVACNNVDVDVVNAIKNSNDGKIPGIPYSLALEKTRSVALELYWTTDRFELTWKKFIGTLVEQHDNEIKDRVFDRLSLVTSSDNTYRLILTTRYPILPFKCKIKKKLESLIKEHFMVLTSMICLSSCAWFLYDNYFTAWYHAKIIASISESIIDSLSSGKQHTTYSIPELEQIYLPKIIPGSELRRFNKKCIEDQRTGLPRWIFCNNDERELLWSRICTQVSKNPCVREVFVNADGECSPQWKWIGKIHEITKFAPSSV